MSGIKIKVRYLGTKSAELQIATSVKFTEIANILFSSPDFKYDFYIYRSKQSNQYAFVLRNILIQGDDLNKQFSQYSNKNEDLQFLVGQELIDYINSNSNLGPPLNQTMADLKIEIIVQSIGETMQLQLEADSLSLNDIYEYLVDSNKVSKIKNVAFLHQQSASFYEFNTFSTKLSDVPNFQKDSKLIYLDGDLVEQYRPQKIIQQQQIQQYDDQNQKKNQQSPQKALSSFQVQGGIKINIISEDGSSRRNFSYVNINPNITVMELKQQVCSYQGFYNSDIVDVDLLNSEGSLLTCPQKMTRSLSELNLAQKEITIIAKTRWIGG